MLAFVLVLVLLLTYQVGRQIDIAGPDQARVIRDQQRVEEVVAGLGMVDVQIESEVGRQDITFGSEALFDSGSPRLSEAGRDLIGRLASAVATADIGSLEEIQVGGHTDTVATGAEPLYTNLELSADRATNVVRSLTASGIDPTQVKISATGYGEHVPVATNETDSGRAANRRIEVRLVYAQDDDDESTPE